MNNNERIAYHEAAHVVVSYLFGGGPTLHGIDISASTSVPDAFGNAGVGILTYNPDQPEKRQRADLVNNVAIICAGAACDAITLGRSLCLALDRQPSDLAAAKAQIANSPLLASSDEAERQVVLQLGLKHAQTILDRPDVWIRVEKIAKACIKNGGKLSKAEIEEHLAQ